MERETFTKTYTGAVAEITYSKSVLNPEGDPVKLRLTIPGIKPNISEECALRNAHKLADGCVEWVLNFSL